MSSTATKTVPGRDLVEELGIRLFDADNHYYEPPDCFTRYLDPGIARQAIRWVTTETGQYRLLVNGQLLKMIVNPRFDDSAVLARPGGQSEMFRSGLKVDRLGASAAIDSLTDRPEYQHRDARLAVMDRQLVEKNWLFPTLGVTIEEFFVEHAQLIAPVLGAFNRWIEEEWGFAYQDRIHAVPHLSLVDVDSAVEQLEWVLARGAKLVDLRGCPVPGGLVGRSLADPQFDPFWARVSEAGIAVSFHAGDLGQQRRFSSDWGENPNPTPHDTTRFQLMHAYRSPYDTAAALILHGLFDRFPKLRIIFVEQGASWAPLLIKNLKKVSRRVERGARLSTDLDVMDTFRQHFWFEPYPEEDLEEAIEVLGEDRVVFGSDWPHVEGTTEPAAFFNAGRGRLSDATLVKVMRGNALSLMEPQS